MILTEAQLTMVFYSYVLLVVVLVTLGVKIYFQRQQIEQLKQDDRQWWMSYRRQLESNDQLHEKIEELEKAAKIREPKAQ